MNANKWLVVAGLSLLVFLPSGVLGQATQGQTSSTTAQSGSGAATKASSHDLQATAPAFSPDLSGVWIQYPDGPVPGVPGMNAIDERFRPPFTPWGQARFDAARPMQGPTAVAGQENAPTLHCDTAGPPRMLHRP